jgi:hypothetical protein
MYFTPDLIIIKVRIRLQEEKLTVRAHTSIEAMLSSDRSELVHALSIVFLQQHRHVSVEPRARA